MGPAIWLSMARDDLRAAELLVEHGIVPLSYLHADQAIEKALWALRLHREGPGGGAGQPATEDASSVRRWLSSSSRPGAERRGIASALASLTTQPALRPPAGEKAEEELAREAVQAAHQVIDRITERVYGGDAMA